jgi:Neocarzinostatin family
MGRFRNRSKLWGPAGVVLAIIVGGTLPIALSTAGPASSLSAQPPVATCSPPSGSSVPPTTPPIPVPTTPTKQTTTTTTTAIVPPPLCVPTLTVIPSAELADGQTVVVNGTGFTPNDSVGMAECASSAVSPSNCDLSTVQFAQTDSTGAFSTDYTVTRDITANDTNIDCALTPCLLGAADLSDYSIDAAAAISFNPTIPPELTGTVSPTGTVNTTTGTAYITGTVACTEPILGVEVDVNLAQVYHHRWNFTSSGYSEVNCTATKKGTKWKVSVPPGFGLFGVGQATAQVDVSGEIGSGYRNVEFSGNVVLKSKS